MSFEAAVTFFVSIFIFAITPGPGVFAILAKAMVEGPKKCIMMALGMVASDLLYLQLACFGLATIADNWSDIFLIIRYLGAGYLIYLGYKMITAFTHNQPISNQQKSQQTPLTSFSHGFLISASNPKVILFYVSFLPTFIDLTRLHGSDLILISVLSSIALMTAIMLVAYGASRLANVIKTPIAQQRLNKTAGSIMIAAGAYLAVNK
ncbi:threonine transporter [Photobacterium iliopiscarium]|uniref:LysE family translocator n=1 Tax=Photobacterium iliopiscarium TaxID=56192 RepID=A0ABX5GP68_9GAMM|nr:LysE family translocator [Photobacterium iliopiscarium]KJG13662.1 threonine transporter [Photobacterium iliopiscarium]KJG24348.1 threonine transporter [Photobacterium iliopiscarium]PST99215.1 LysE family translocator [Photobacterium iliopiscarium]PSV85012.1 LysE family translocator [Photobacterium iliopiscarium]PSW92945.1 LysE family translocator [Photobacterium iliopiscarium]